MTIYKVFNVDRRYKIKSLHTNSVKHFTILGEPQLHKTYTPIKTGKNDETQIYPIFYNVVSHVECASYASKWINQRSRESYNFFVYVILIHM